MTTRKTKPWIHYRENEAAPAHLIHTPKRKSAKTARILMLFLGQLGMQRFYIDERAAGWRWVFGMLFGQLFAFLFIQWAMFSASSLSVYFEEHRALRNLLIVLVYSPFLAWIVIEWRSLPRRVEAWNAKHLTANNL